MKNYFKILGLLFLFLLNGCANIALRPIADHNQGPYFYALFICDTLEQTKTKNDAISRSLYLCCVVDLPFDFLADTIFLPWDYLMHK